MADSKDKRVFDYDGTEYAVVRPSMQQLTKANEVRRKTFNEELSAGTILRDQLDEELRKRKLWSDARESRYQALRQEVVDLEFALAKGGISLIAAKEKAVDMRRKRAEMVDMLSSRTDLDSITCEGKADAVRFNFLFANCLVYNDSGDLYFKNGLTDYLMNQGDPVAGTGATEFYYLISDSDDVDSKLPENQFLKKFKFTNETGQLVDKQGKLVDTEGRHIDEYGNYIKWNSEEDFTYVDFEGRPLTDQGDFDVEHSPFLDENGKPIDESSYEEQDEEETEAKVEEKEAPKPKRKPRKKTTTAAKDSK